MGLESSYLLVVRIPTSVEVSLGRKRWYFNSGYYVYVGSARVFRPYIRILRHFLKEKRRWWHIDYLTSEEYVEVVLGLILYGVSESSLYSYLARVRSFEPVAPGFGASDSPDHVTHLFRFSQSSPDSLYEELGRVISGLAPRMVELVL